MIQTVAQREKYRLIRCCYKGLTQLFLCMVAGKPKKKLEITETVEYAACYLPTT